MLGIWLTVIVIAVAFEIATQLQLVSVWAAVGGIVALITDVCGVDQTIQIIIFFAVTFIMLALTRPFVRRMTNSIKNTPTNADMNIGRTGKVTKIVDTSAGLFRVSVAGADWSAVTQDRSIPEVGSDIRVERIEGVKLVVSSV
ncbi:MAG: NfeD family protein [Clostridia bacterium]|nr:NfeD family protein [Clostridia bacterium]